MSESRASSSRPGSVQPQHRVSESGEEYQAHYGYLQTDTTQKQLEEILDLLVRRRWTLLLTWLSITAVVVAYTFTRVPEYEADSYIMVDLGQIGSLAGDVNIGGRNVTANGGLATELFILQTSRQIEERVHSRLLELEGSQAGASEGPIKPQALSDGRVRVLPASPQVPNAIRVSAISPSPENAALLANLYTEEYILLAKDANRTSLSVRRASLEELVSVREQELQEAEEKATAYMIRKDAVGLDQETQYMVSTIAQLESRRDDARIELHMRQTSLETAEKELETINPQLVKRFASNVEGKMEMVHRKLNELEQEKEQIILRNPDLESGSTREKLEPINEQIRSLQARLDDLSRDYVAEVMAAGGISNSETGLTHIVELKKQIIRDRISIDGFRSRVDLMESQLAGHQRELSKVPEVSLELTRLERNRLYAEEQYQSILKQLQQARLAEESQPGYASVIREATRPYLPVSPNIPRNLTLGIILGLVAGLGIAVVRDKFDNRINKPDELRKHGHAVLGVVPNLNSFIQQRYSGASFGKKDGHPYSTSLVSLLDPMEPSTEAYRHIRTNIQFSIPDKVIRSILVTSPSSGDGKSTVAANLAIVMAQSGRRTLLIDADLRRPQQHHLFAVKREPGLVQVLFRECGLEPDVFKTGIENLSLITAGGLSKQAGDAKTNGSNGEFAEVPNPAELLGSRRMREILDEIHNSYDVVIIDSPPVLAATDAVLLSTQCDATILVTRAGKTKEGELVFSQEALRDVGATMIGTLLNAFDIKMAYGLTYRYGAYSKYGYYSKYAYGTTASGKRRRQKS